MCRDPTYRVRYYVYEAPMAGQRDFFVGVFSATMAKGWPGSAGRGRTPEAPGWSDSKIRSST